MQQATRIDDFSLSLKTPGQPTIDVRRFREHFQLSQQALASFAGVHRATVAHGQANEKLQRLMRDALRVVSASASITGDEDRAIYWMRNTPIPEFDHRTAMDLVAQGKTDAVREVSPVNRVGLDWMISAALGSEAIFYRAFTPRWAHQPESGEGAALAGGRFNRPGIHARNLERNVIHNVCQARPGNQRTPRESGGCDRPQPFVSRCRGHSRVC